MTNLTTPLTRRKFFGLFAAATAVAAVAPKLLSKAKQGYQGFVDVTFSTKELRMGLDDFEHRILEPAIKKLHERMDHEIANMDGLHTRVAMQYDIADDIYPIHASIARELKLKPGIYRLT